MFHLLSYNLINMAKGKDRKRNKTQFDPGKNTSKQEETVRLVAEISTRRKGKIKEK